jgi:hypothetical protein
MHKHSFRQQHNHHCFLESSSAHKTLVLNMCNSPIERLYLYFFSDIERFEPVFKKSKSAEKRDGHRRIELVILETPQKRTLVDLRGVLRFKVRPQHESRPRIISKTAETHFKYGVVSTFWKRDRVVCVVRKISRRRRRLFILPLDVAHKHMDSLRLFLNIRSISVRFRK